MFPPSTMWHLAPPCEPSDTWFRIAWVGEGKYRKLTTRHSMSRQAYGRRKQEGAKRRANISPEPPSRLADSKNQPQPRSLGEILGAKGDKSDKSWGSFLGCDHRADRQRRDLAIATSTCNRTIVCSMSRRERAVPGSITIGYQVISGKKLML